MTNEEPHDETALVCESAKVLRLCSSGGGGAQCGGDESLELADAADFRVASDHLLASTGAAAAREGSLRSAWRRIGTADRLASSDDGALEPDDARGAREIHAGHEGPLWPIRAPGRWAHGVSLALAVQHPHLAFVVA